MTIQPSPLDLFDASCTLRYARWYTPGAPSTASELAETLASYGIGAALVHHAGAVWHNPHLGNQWLLSEVGGYPDLYPCWVLMPHQPGEVPPPDQVVDLMIASGVRAARVFPRDHRFALRLWNVGTLLERLATHRLPLWVDFGHQHWDSESIDWDGLYEVCAAFPALPLVLVRPDIASNRRLFALMERFANLYIETSYYTVHRGIEVVCRQFGPGRILFGTGLPLRAPGPAITALRYSLIDDEARALVGGANLRRLLEEVKL
jgi:hypothetical protein